MTNELIKPSDLKDEIMQLFNNEIPGNQEVEKIFIEKHHLVIKHRTGFDYDILLTRFAHYNKIVGWIAHLNEKNWFTVEVLDCLLSVLNGHFNGIIEEAR